jgi:thiamine biosynthesis lipoprotein
MGTVVTIEVVRSTDAGRDGGIAPAIDRAIGWFHAVETACNRFDPNSEARKLSHQIGAAVPVSAILFDAVRFALAVADESGGAFDPTVGAAMEERGFSREYQSGAVTSSGVDASSRVSYRDVQLDLDARTIMLGAPLVLDLGAVAKGLAIDLAARELGPFEHYAIDAGGDLYLAGLNSDGAPWSVGIRHPRAADECIETLHISNAAVCTSGDYERRTPRADGGHHILDPRTASSASSLASVTVVANSAMVADALATAAFVLGPTHGLQFLERSGVHGLMITPALERFSTSGMPRAAILPNP